MGTYHKPYKGKKGSPVKKASGKKIKATPRVSGTLAQRDARAQAKRYTRGKGKKT